MKQWRLHRLLVCCAAAAIVLASTQLGAQSSTTAPASPATRIGWLSPVGKYGQASFEAFRTRLRNLGYTEGRNIVIDARWAEDSDEKLERLSKELVGTLPQLIVTQTKAVYSVRAADASMPVVFGFSGDPVIGKLANSLARPGRNMTGVSLMSLELVGKRMQVLKEMLPAMKKVAVIANPAHPGEQAELDVSRVAAKALGLSLDYYPVRSEAELDLALAAISRARDEAIVLFPDNGTVRYSERIARFTRQTRIPAISGWAEFADRGNVVTYGPDVREAYAALAVYVDKILKGARPGELPIELPTRVELVVNLAAARAIGLIIPQSVLLRADRVIQ